jgi:hypothetical protein
MSGRRADRPDDAKFESATIPQRRRSDVDLSDPCLLRKELAIWKVGSEQQERIAVFHRPIAGCEADESRHPDVEGIIVFDEFLAAKRVDDGRFEFPGKLDDLVMCAAATGTAEERHALTAVQHLG